MGFKVEYCEEKDFMRFVVIQIAAFNSGIAAELFERPLTEELKRKQADKHIKSQWEEKDCHFLKLIDDELEGEESIIAVAKWRINEKERTEEQIQIQLPNPKDGENEASRDFFEYLRSTRLEFMGTKPFCFLHILATDPKHQGRGAGSLLLQWGTQRADKAQLPSYLESTEAGRRTYLKAGFKQVKRTEFQMSKYGGSPPNEPPCTCVTLAHAAMDAYNQSRLRHGLGAAAIPDGPATTWPCCRSRAQQPQMYPVGHRGDVFFTDLYVVYGGGGARPGTRPTDLPLPSHDETFCCAPPPGLRPRT
ncbi:hypothetical protein BDV96DRAFT_649106 [Lophiotrema nucula]|uniref:N-acetyltransferase domain-containing protein n=1 Tax=Lophiotrema nucula TaxID=690887 RepID=A0A6A5YYS1_9PLEO|nr:hypothetical protein BDV96DRAFT_649106 [Lophiotrema nucula]